MISNGNGGKVNSSVPSALLFYPLLLYPLMFSGGREKVIGNKWIKMAGTFFTLFVEPVKPAIPFMPIVQVFGAKQMQ